MATLQSSVNTLSIFVFFLVIFPAFSGTTLGVVYGSFNRSSFPPGFLFGAASSAYQFEGAAFEGGKGPPRIRDTFTHKFPDEISDKSNGDVALDFYHKYKDDVKLLKYIGLDAFRLSISWPKILPPKQSFSFINGGYDGSFIRNLAPGRCSSGGNCPQGNSATEPYIAETAFAAFNRSSFPPGFLFGAASSAYQIEGAAFEDGRGPSIWDSFTHRFPEKIADRSNGDVANDFYHRYKHDVKLMKYMGLDTFRMSISWSRILPRGKLSGGVNKEGIAFYNNVFNELLANGITPFVTIFHWDLPQALEDEYGGFLSPCITDDFRDFAELCFKEFGDRIKYWFTVNEPISYANGGYDGGLVGNFAPGRCSNRTICPQGNSSTEPYIVGHHLLLSHATTIKLYKEKYQAIQKGKIGITLVTHWFIPYSNTTADAKAAQRALDFIYGWFINPIVYGNYPRIMRTLVGNRLPKFTKEQSAMLKGSFDFLGLNYYTSFYATHILSRTEIITSTTDNMARFLGVRNGVPIGDPTGVGTYYVYPKGFHDLLVYTMKKYKNPAIYITENGMGDQNNGTVKQGITDLQRISFYLRHLHAVRKAIRGGVNVKGFNAWSFMDVFEWNSGYTFRFGLTYVDYKNGLKRIPKKSAIWFKNFLGKK